MSWRLRVRVAHLSGAEGVLPPPLWGRAGEGGSPSGSLCWGTPTPNPSPQGGGERTVRAVKAGGYLTRVDTIELKPARSVGVAA